MNEWMNEWMTEFFSSIKPGDENEHRALKNEENWTNTIRLQEARNSYNSRQNNNIIY